MKSRLIIFGMLFSLVLMLAGCSGEEVVEPTSSGSLTSDGMVKVQNMEYTAALEDFAAAEEAGEEIRLVKRGQGLAYMGLTQYENAVEAFGECLALSDGTVRDIDFDVN